MRKFDPFFDPTEKYTTLSRSHYHTLSFPTQPWFLWLSVFSSEVVIIHRKHWTHAHPWGKVKQAITALELLAPSQLRHIFFLFVLGRNLVVSFSPRSFVFPLFRAMKAYCLFLKISLCMLSEDLNYIRHLVDVCFSRPTKCCGIIYVWLCKNAAKDCLRENIQLCLSNC